MNGRGCHLLPFYVLDDLAISAKCISLCFEVHKSASIQKLYTHLIIVYEM
jgi:hypothetical protein